ASKKLEVPVEKLTVSKGIVSVTGDSNRSVKYGDLVGDKRFNLPVTGSAPIKSVREYKIVGSSAQRNDMPDKVSGTYVYMQQVRVPGMLHGRAVRPRGQSAYGTGAKVVAVDENSIRNIPGAHVLRRGDFIGVVAEREWDAVQAAAQLKVTWDVRP